MQNECKMIMVRTALIRYSLENLRKRGLRSWLTVLSVLISIAAITTLISFGNGISAYVSEISKKMGDDKLIVQPRGFGFGPPPIDSNVRLDDSDLDAIRGVSGVDEATGVYVLSGEIEFGKQKKYAFVMGSDFEEYPRLINEVYTLRLIEGDELSGDENSEAILGYNYMIKDKIFEKAVRLRDKIKLNGQEMKVGGFYEEVGNPHDDSNLYITKDAAEDVYGADNYQFILVRASPGRSPTKLVEDIKEKLRKHRNQNKGREDFFVETFEQVIATFNAVLGVITGVVILIALISIVVAAVNIMNTMYASILERTREIGVFKAIGSRNRDILFMFVLESGILSLIGGIAGVVVGYSVSKYAGSLISNFGYSVFTPLFTWELVAGSILFAFAVGVISGLMPAYRASKLKPIEALRYE